MTVKAQNLIPKYLLNSMLVDIESMYLKNVLMQFAVHIATLHNNHGFKINLND